MSYAEVIREHARLSILRVLAAQGGYSANGSVLADALAAYGLKLSRDQVRVEIDWLAEQGLVTADRVGDLVVATATGRGLDVADGRAVVTGVKRPSPR